MRWPNLALLLSFALVIVSLLGNLLGLVGIAIFLGINYHYYNQFLRCIGFRGVACYGIATFVVMCDIYAKIKVNNHHLLGI